MVSAKSILFWALAASHSFAAPEFRDPSQPPENVDNNVFTARRKTSIWHRSLIASANLPLPNLELAKKQFVPQDGLAEAAKKGGFERFEWVVDHLRPGDKLARSSAPFYNGKDTDQQITPLSIAFLKGQGIAHVISVNSDADNKQVEWELRMAGIDHTALLVADYASPTIEQLKQAYDAFRRHRAGTLVWCGFGHGRTGTTISALQILSEKETGSGYRFTNEDFDKNHVESAAQLERLNALQNALFDNDLQN